MATAAAAASALLDAATNATLDAFAATPTGPVDVAGGVSAWVSKALAVVMAVFGHALGEASTLSVAATAGKLDLSAANAPRVINAYPLLCGILFGACALLVYQHRRKLQWALALATAAFLLNQWALPLYCGTARWLARSSSSNPYALSSRAASSLLYGCQAMGL